MPPITPTTPALGAPTRRSFALTLKEAIDFLNGQSGGSLSTLGLFNGSFEVGSGADTAPSAWEISIGAGNSSAFDTADPAHGAQAFAMTNPGGSSGGVVLTSLDFIAIAEGVSFTLSWWMKSTVATVTNAVKVRFFDRTETLVSTVTVWSSATANPTSWTQKAFSLIPPANARYFKIIIEGVNSTTAGTAYWDGFDVQSNINCPVGSIKEYAGSAVQVGYLNCDGSAVSRTEYAALFAIIGTTFGVGDGSTTFNLPDKRGRTGIGAGTGSGLTARTLGTMLGNENLQSHTHEINTDNSDVGSDVTLQRRTNFANVNTVTTQAAGTGNAGNMQPSLVLNYQIKI